MFEKVARSTGFCADNLVSRSTSSYVPRNLTTEILHWVANDSCIQGSVNTVTGNGSSDAVVDW